MFALSDYYISLFGFLVEQDAEGQGAWDWVIPLAGSDLPWEENGENSISRGLDRYGKGGGGQSSSATRLENLRALERSSTESSTKIGGSTSSAYSLSAAAVGGKQSASALTPKCVKTSDEEDSDWLLNFQQPEAPPRPPPVVAVRGALRKTGDKLNGSSSGNNSSSSSSSSSSGKSGVATAAAIWEGLVGSVMHDKHESKRVKFCSTAQCVLIPSRSDLQAQGINDLLWFDEAVLEQSKREAQEELQKTLATNSSSLSLYAAMSLLYRPCIKGSNDRRDHFRLLVVDDSVVARRMFIQTIVSGHKASGTKEHLYVHQADSYKSALESIQTHTYNLIVVDEFLSPVAGEASGFFGSDLIRHARAQLENCVLIGISGYLDMDNENTEVGRETRKRMNAAGADIVLRKPVPRDTWQQLLTCLPIEF